MRATADRLVARVGHWTPARWSQPAPRAQVGRGATRADAAFVLVQRLADLAAEAEGRPPQQVPRLDNDLALPDQVRVMVFDLLAAGAPDTYLSDAAAWIDATVHTL